MTIKEKLLDFGYPKFINNNLANKIEKDFGSPCYIYSEKELEDRANEFLAFPNAFGCNVKFAMKACSNKNIVKLFGKKGIGIDASSEYEVYRAINAGIDGNKIQISSQELPENIEKLLDTGVFFVATSLNQIKEIGKIRPGIKIGLRINPGVGSANFKQINTGGWISSFGIWHEHLTEAKKIAHENNLIISKVHIHIGSENTPKSWVRSAHIGLDFVRELEEVDTLDLGGGYKMAIMPYEQTADLQEIGNAVKERFEEFYKETGRKIKLEVEPGKYLVINTCSFLTKVQDIVDTGEYGYKFLRMNSGMNDMPRVPMYGIQEPIYIMNKELEKHSYVVAGHCCESSDIMTSKLYDQETVEPRKLNKANIGDLMIIDGVGAYNSSMSMKNYNSFPESGEIMIMKNGEIKEIRKRQKLEDIWRNEVEII